MKELVFLGDLFYNYQDVHADVKAILDSFQGASVILNLEGTLSDSGRAIKKRGPNLAQSAKTIELLKQTDVFGVCLANNHILDYGAEGLADTISCLDENGIKHAGAGANLQEACKPIEIIHENSKIAIFNFGWAIEEVVPAGENSYGSAPRKESIILECVKEAVQKGFLPIVVMHWGFEYNLHPQPMDRSLAHKMIDAGAELVIGHHPHVLQGKEEYKGKMIYYSLGNFYFSGRRNTFKKEFCTAHPKESDYGLAVKISLDGQKICAVAESFVLYNPETEVSAFTEDYVLSDYSQMEIDRKYGKLIVSGKRNHNPVLYDTWIGRMKLGCFQFLFRGVLRFVWKKLLRR